MLDLMVKEGVLLGLFGWLVVDYWLLIGKVILVKN